MVSNTSFKTKITSWGWAADTGGPSENQDGLG